jgi:hypothetical protein
MNMIMSWKGKATELVIDTAVLFIFNGHLSGLNLLSVAVCLGTRWISSMLQGLVTIAHICLPVIELILIP